MAGAVVTLRPVDVSADRSLVAAISDLHLRLLPTSPLSRLGRRFLRGFYYGTLTADGTIWGCIALADGKSCGFVAATSDAAGFMARASKRHGLRMAWALAPSLAVAPGRIAALFEAGRINDELRHDENGWGRVGEILSLGVLPEYRAAQFVRSSGVHIGERLLEAALEKLRSLGVERVRAVVDKDNTQAKLFYSAQEWEVEEASLEGWRVPTMSFALSLK